MSDESDLNCFKGHILNKEIDRAKVIYSRKQEEFSHLISQQPKQKDTVRYSNLPQEELGTSLIPEDVTGAEGSLNNHCSNTPDTSGVKLNINKNCYLFCHRWKPYKR